MLARFGLHAVEIRRGKVSDTELELLREGIKALPLNRRRRVRSLSEAPWFEPLINEMLRASVPNRRRILDEILAELRNHTVALKKLAERSERCDKPPPS